VHAIAVAVAGRDGFPLDDRRTVIAEPPRGLGALVINGDPRTVRNEDETFFLGAALGEGGAGMNVTTILPDDAGSRLLGAYAAVFMCNVAAPSQELADALARYVEGGGGLFISLGDKVNPDVWNQRMAKVLPQPLGLVRTAAAAPSGSGSGEVVDTRPAERLAPLDRSHPLLAPFTADGAGLLSARIYRFMLLGPLPEAPNRRTVLRFESGAPALVESEIGRGRVLLLTTTVDRDWTDLAIRPGFLPLVQEAARRLSGAPARERTAPVLVGQGREIALPAGDTVVEVQPPEGAARVFHENELAKPGTLLFRQTDEPGLYQVRSGDKGELAALPGEAFAAVLDARESDPAARPEAAPPDAAHGEHESGPKRRVELWHGLAAAIVLLVLAESLLTLRRVRR